MQLNYLKKHLHPSNNRNCSLDYSFSNSNIITNNTNKSLYTLTYNNSNLSNKFLPKNNLSRNLPNRKNNSVESTLSINKKTSSNVSQENIILNNNYLAKENEKLHKLNSIYNKTNLMLKEKLNNYVYNKYTTNKINRFSSGNLLINNNEYKKEIELENNIKLLKSENNQLKNKIENLTNLLLSKENEIKLLKDKLNNINNMNNSNNLNTMNEILNKLKIFLENNQNNINNNINNNNNNSNNNNNKNNNKNKNKKIPNCKLNFRLKKLNDNNNNNFNIKLKDDDINNKINYILKTNEKKNEEIFEIQNKLSDILRILYNNNINQNNNNNHNNFFNSPNHSSLFTPPLNRNKSSFYFSNSKKNNNFKNNNNSISYCENPEESNLIQNKTLSELYSENNILKKQLETINEINYISNDKKIQNLQEENERLITENELLKNECDKVNLKFDKILKHNFLINNNSNNNSQSDSNNSINNNNNNKYLFQIYNKNKILRFNLTSFIYDIIEPADYDNYKQIISETNLKNIIIYNTLEKLFILIGKESNYLFSYDNNNMSLNKLIQFKYNHNLGGIIYNENINSIIAISGKNCNKCEIFNLKKKKLSLLPDDKYYRGESIYMLYNNILFCMFGFDYKENKFINEIDCINFNDDNDDENNDNNNKKEYFWKNYSFKFKDKIINDNINNNYNFNIKNGICMQLLNNEILILSKYNNNNILKLNIIENEIEELNNENFLNGFNDNFKGIQEFILLKNNNDNNKNNEYLVNIDNNYNVHILQLNNFEYNIYNYN